MEFLTNDGLTPFLFFAVLVVGLLLIEVLFSMIGFSTTIDTGGDVDADLDIDVDADVEWPGADLDEITASDTSSAAPATGLGTILDLLGLRNLPVTVWLAVFSASFASIGLAGQAILHGITGFMLPAGLAGGLAFVPAVLLSRVVSGVVGRFMPRDESSAISERSYGRRHGVVTVGVARYGSPAQVRFTDNHGNLHYVMVEPLDKNDEIAEGSEVLIIKTLRDGLKLIKTGDA